MAGSEIKVMWERILNYTITEQKTSNIHEFLKAHGYSSSLIRAIKEDTEGIRLNGEPVLARTLLTPGDQLAIRITETKFSENIVPSDLPLSIVYEDPDLLVINKPAGMPIHLPREIMTTHLPMPVHGISKRKASLLSTAALTGLTGTPPVF